MEYHILTGEEFNIDFLPQIMALDAQCYAQEYVGELAMMEERYLRNKRSFVCVMDGERLVGYINFFPVQDALWEEIVETGQHIRDDDIRGDEMADYSAKDPNRLFIISVVISPDYRSDKNAVITLTNGFADYLNRLEAEGYPIDAISATAVSEDGMKFLRTRNFRLYREIEDENKVYVCDGIYLRKLLKKEFYIKTYRDDIYLFLPYADNPKNPKRGYILENGFNYDDPDFAMADEARLILQELESCLKYECQNDVVQELTRTYLGEFLFLHTMDDYLDADDPEERPTIVGEETVHISILAHESSHMYVVMLFIPNCRYSTTQVEDQNSQEYIKIRKKEDMDENGFYQYVSLNDYLREQYGLIRCGQGKNLICMSNKPEDEHEFYNILTGEVYNSVHQSFQIDYPALKECAQENKAIYDYYETYLTEIVDALILKGYDDGIEERLPLIATYIFIVEMVVFQNTSLNKMTQKVTRALAQDGEVSLQYIQQLYQDYARTVKFWQRSNFKYFGTQREADRVREAFGNEGLRRDYYEQQEFLEHMVELKNAQDEKRSNNVINIVAIILAVVQVQSFFVAVISKVYGWFGIGVSSAEDSINMMLISGILFILLVWYLLYRKGLYMERKSFQKDHFDTKAQSEIRRKDKRKDRDEDDA